MDFRAENDKKKIREFLDLVENHKIEIRHYKTPVLVWTNIEGVCHYSFWEEETLERFGLDNVDGWDYKEDLLFCPDWVADEEEEDDFDDDESDEDLCKFCEKIRQ
ncbi:MAG: hypothetical protein RBR69_06770 [Candidatus Cloacimonadaceae bacterium]|jgi:hypothetical protein|nr:hypothetical protein [Candidatus Cloacimonadota bacterium]MDY0127813.1 hypothetical protein [Candidatus Cloacimonadaceae bacterium]MCB5254861.1 hypothetical protein [Candidatus Cloacimonadota bacterium]MCK9177918.1 hypothetical protein [Candidatus Cloacimonadota bacterium]MCK9242334.1 hypothetical protein [Candidatus Cloacimonadota bacterium]